MKKLRIFLYIFILINTHYLFAENPIDEKDKKIEYLTEKVRQLEILYKREQILRIALEIEGDVEDLRGLKFKNHVSLQTIGPDKLKEYLNTALNEVLPQSKIDAYEVVFYQLGFINQPIDFKDLMIKLYSEQVAGFYDDQTKQLYVVDKFDIDDKLTRMIIAHEICHALQDQNYNIAKLPYKDPNNDDLAMAVTSIVEGDAMTLMSEYAVKNISLSMITELSKYLEIDQSALTNAPFFIQQSLLFPYIEGMEFINYINFNEISDKRESIFIDYPKSTEQILHPEKFFVNRDDPTTFSLQNISDQLGIEWKEKINNVFGEASIKMYFQESLDYNTASMSAEGWDGDRYALYENESGDIIIYWKSIWDSQTDAQEFYDSFINKLKITNPSIKIETNESNIATASFDKKNIKISRDNEWVSIIVSSKKELLDIIN